MASKQAVLARMRATRAAAKADLLEIGAAVGTAYVVGRMAKSGSLTRVPDILGMPKTLTLAVAGKLIAYNVNGKAKQLTNGAATGAACVAAYQFGHGEPVSGVSGRSPRALQTEEEIAKRLTQSIKEKLEDMQDVAAYPAE